MRPLSTIELIRLEKWWHNLSKFYETLSPFWIACRRNKVACGWATHIAFEQDKDRAYLEDLK
jgi:hypothetical protein